LKLHANEVERDEEAVLAEHALRRVRLKRTLDRIAADIARTRIPPRWRGGCQRANTPSVMLSRQISDSSM
jgi:hypothetical protein